MPRLFLCFGAGLISAFLAVGLLSAEPVDVRYQEGSAHGFLSLSTLDGKRIATGDLVQTVRGSRVTSRLTFHFMDGSLDDDTTVFSQRGRFRLISDHHIQHGPSFPKASDVLIDAISGQVTARSADGTVRQEHVDQPPDVADGLPSILLKNVSPRVPETVVSYVVVGSSSSVIHLSIKPVGKVPFSVGGSRREAVDYLVHPELGVVKGVIAPLIGKKPADTHIWILTGPSPAFIREEGQMYEGGPIWRVEQISPSFAR